MAGGTKRLPRAVREQQMLDAAVEVFSRKGYHDTSMDAIAAEAKISKPMLYLYYGSKDELFRACIQRESIRFIEAVAVAGNPKLTPHEQLRAGLEAFLSYVDQNRLSWQVLYRQALDQQPFASEIANSRERVIELTAKLLASNAKYAEPGTNFDIVSVAVIGAGEAIADRIASGEVAVADAVDLLDDLAWRGLAGKKKPE
ncbi:TetR/AcrR family transcriptional regulator [Nocardia sp. alder85J]|uniref:TetR/AcrR family transcriptional regulator n=1 Tax=Nocardia sp. alder85J TaxID=2862949 RepID=UPI001CD61F97|nr:TetR/AcrR family transcriptional regulator [Nocardia sp. alder85J]MCX4096297.1 TetR/AcrR family transcriptional regulator [Nocardia sp. alder85J]